MKNNPTMIGKMARGIKTKYSRLYTFVSVPTAGNSKWACAGEHLHSTRRPLAKPSRIDTPIRHPTERKD